jgi:hypothetical protein
LLSFQSVAPFFGRTTGEGRIRHKIGKDMERGAREQDAEGKKRSRNKWGS